MFASTHTLFASRARPSASTRASSRARSISCAASPARPDASGLRPLDARTSQHIACVAAQPSKTAAPELNKFQEFGRQYWPAFAVLEGVALVGATVNGILSRKRRLEIERLNTQMRGIMAKLDERDTTLVSEDGSTEASEALAAAKSAMASDHNERASELFANAIAIAEREKDPGAELSARKGLAMSLAAQRKFADAATELETCLRRSEALEQTDGDSVVYGLLGDVYTDLGDFTKAGAAYDMCIRVLD